MSQTTSNLYAVLGVPRDASEEQIRRAYRRLAKRYHPDLHPDAQTSEQMLRVNQAWETLSSPSRRARYDAEAAMAGPATIGHWSAPARRSSPATSPAQAWSSSWGSPAAAPSYPRSWPTARDDEGAGWPAVVLRIAFGLLVFVALISGILPAPLFVILLFVIARGILGRVE